MHDSRTLLVTLLAAAALWGCTRDVTLGIGAPILDSHFGEAVTRAREMQVINPNGVPVNDGGYSGKAAQSAIERYESSRAVAPPPMPAAPAAPTGAPAPDAAARNGK